MDRIIINATLIAKGVKKKCRKVETSIFKVSYQLFDIKTSAETDTIRMYLTEENINYRIAEAKCLASIKMRSVEWAELKLTIGTASDDGFTKFLLHDPREIRIPLTLPS